MCHCQPEDISSWPPGSKQTNFWPKIFGQYTFLKDRLGTDKDRDALEATFSLFTNQVLFRTIRCPAFIYLSFYQDSHTDDSS